MTAMDVGTVAAWVSISCGVASLLLLLLLHPASPEFQPSWRMISEYALGDHKWMLTGFFLLWGTSSISLAVALWLHPTTTGWMHLGLALLVISGIGAIFGGLYDVNHPRHGLAFALGVPTLPIAALIVGYALSSQPKWDAYALPIQFASHATWISLVIMAIAMVVMMSRFKRAGIPMGPDTPAPTHVPDGVIALAGYANRLLVVCYEAWVIVLAFVYLRLP